jgi:SSS family solute:Na+ symporter
MQFMVLLVGLMVFVFYQFNTAPLHFNQSNVEIIKESTLQSDYIELEKALAENNENKSTVIHSLIQAVEKENANSIDPLQVEVMTYVDREKALRKEARELIGTYNDQNNTKLEASDTDYVFIHFIMTQLPIGLIGLLLAVIFSAAMSSTAAELNALATTSVVDIYKRNFVPEASDQHYLFVSKLFTVLWGIIALSFAMMASLFDNLIEAVNIIGSLFYGTILGIFVVAFFLKKVNGTGVFIAAIIGEIIVLTLFALDHYEVIDLAYLWLNMVGCMAVVIASLIFSNGKDNKS